MVALEFSLTEILDNITGFIQNTWTTFTNLIGAVARLPEMMHRLFPFIPSGIITAMIATVTFSLILGVVRWIRE